MARESNTPGLQWRKREAGERRAYWVARDDLIKRGYKPKSVPLIYDPKNPMAMSVISSQCMRLQAEMLQWANRGNAPVDTIYDGKLATLINIYLTHEDSPYRENHPNTQRKSAWILDRLLKRLTDPYVDELTGNEIRRWHRNMVAEGKSDGYAALTIAILKAAVSFGVSLAYDDCIKLRPQMKAAKIGAGKRRTEELTYDHVRAFCAEAHRIGRPSAALWVTAQFDLIMRRRDVIGEWIDIDRDAPLSGIVMDTRRGVRIGKRLWRDGLTWQDIDANGVLRKLISKTAKTSAVWAEHTIANYPDLKAELDRIPLDKRVGPIVINETNGLPYTPEACVRYFRQIARAAGIPDSVQNMDARAGGVTEAYAAGGTTEDNMATAGHTEVATSLRYRRRILTQTSRIAQLRLKAREQSPQN